jgi:hypothetical protein
MPIDVGDLRARGTYQAKLPLPELVANLEAIDRTITAWQAHRKRMNQWGFLLLPLGAMLLAIAVITGFAFLIGLAIPMFFGAFGLFIYSALSACNCCKRQYRGRLIRDLANMVNDDADGKSPVSVEVCFKERKELLTEEPWPVRKKGKQKFFRDRWAAFEAKLLDGCTLSNEVVDIVRERTFVNPRGKTKTKRRIRHLVSTRIIYPPDVYGDVSKCPSKLIEGVRVPSSSRLRGCKVSDHDIKLKAQVDRPEDLKATCVMLALGGYRILNYASNARRRSAGGAAS